MFDLTIDGGVARLAMNRPATRNAIPLGGWDQLAGQATAAGDARILILSGLPGGPFCAGADITGFDAFRDDPDAPADFRRAIRRGLDTLAALPIPTVALVEGGCFGAGVALAMACDMRVAAPDAAFAITPAKLGISYPQEDVHRLVALIGPGQAVRLLITAATIAGGEAERIGLVELCARDAAAAVESIARAVIANDPASIAALKRGVRLAAGGVTSDTRQDDSFDALLGSDALADRLAAYRSRPR